MIAAPPAISVFVTGNPQTKGSLHFWHRWAANGRCMTGTSEQGGPRLAEWRALIATAGKRAMRQEPPLSGPLRVCLSFWFAQPKTVKPDRLPWVYGNKRHDLDKLARACLDAMTDAAVWHDDSQVSVLLCDKRFADAAQRPGVLITVEAL